MPTIIKCPNRTCGQVMQLPDAAFGKRVHCPTCKQVVQVTMARPAVSQLGGHSRLAGPTSCPACGSMADPSATSCPDCGFLLHADAGPSEPQAPPNLCVNPNCGVANNPGIRFCERCNESLPMPVGTLLSGRYRIDKLLKAGGFGAVYRGADTHDADRQVAIKDMLNPDPKEFDLRLKFFKREADILKILERLPHVPRLYDYHHEGKTAHLVMEFLQGQDLLEVMRQQGDQPFPLEDVIEWGKTICDVLQVMHSQSPPLVHRDLKPDNIMLLGDGRTIKLIDFGTARDLGLTQKERAKGKTLVFTEGYAPMEQRIGKPTERSDLFALAATLYHLATGKEPAGSTTGEEIKQQLADPHGPIPAEDRWFYEIIRINLSEKVDDRYPSAMHIRNDLGARRATHVPQSDYFNTETALANGAPPTVTTTGNGGDTLELPTILPGRVGKGGTAIEIDVAPVIGDPFQGDDEIVVVEPLPPEPPPVVVMPEEPPADPMADLRAACQTSPPDWADIFFKASDAQNAGYEIAPDLFDLTQEAEARSKCVQALLVALNGGRLQPIVEAYNPTYLDDWQVYADEVAKAKSACAAVRKLREIEAKSHATENGRDFLQAWFESESELAKWPESESIRKKVQSWKDRIGAVDRLRKLIEQKAPRERAIVEAWDKLKKLGGHPEAAPLEERVKIASARADCLDALPPLDAPETEATDAQMMGAWSEFVLADCPEAEQHRSRYERARQRLQDVDALKAAIAQVEQGQGKEEVIVEAAKRLKTGYALGHQDRVSLAQKRINAAEERQRLADALKKALNAKRPSDKAIAAEYEKARKAGCRFNDQTTARCRLAAQRCQCLQRVSAINQALPLDQRDQEMLKLWDAELLRGCTDADPLRPAHAAAMARDAAWKDVERALAAHDRDRIIAAAENPLLAGYPPLVERQSVLQDLMKQAHSQRQLNELLKKGDPAALVDHLDFTYMRANRDLYLPYRQGIEALLTRWLQETKLAGKSDPTPPQDPISGLVKVRWTWPFFKIISHCRVAVSSDRCFATIAEAKGQTMNWSADDHRRVGGGIEVSPVSGSGRLFVTVWPAIDLGWGELIGPPLHIGPMRIKPLPRS